MSSIRRDVAHPPYAPGRLHADPGEAGKSARKGTLSILIPSKDEAENLTALIEEIVQVFRPMVGRRDTRHRLEAFEVVVIDDGSTDPTARVLRQIAEGYPELRPIALARSVGQSGATVAGFRVARGDWVGLLDADLQNPPADLAALWEALPGYDAALGWRSTREDGWVKRVTSRLANGVRNAVLGQSIRDTGCSIRIFPREVALRLPMFRGAHRFFGPLLLREGCRIIQRPVGHRPRSSGTSHYHFGNRSIRVVVDLLGVFWLMRRPIRIEVVPGQATNRQMPLNKRFASREAGR